MTSGLWFMAVAAGCVSIAVLLLNLVPAYRAFAARRFGLGVWLALPSGELLASIERRVSRRAVAGALGGLAALVVLITVFTAARVAAEDDFAATWVLLGGFFVGVAVGSAINALTEPRREPAGTLHYARAEAVELRDYVAPIERQGARIVVALSVLLAAVIVVLGANRDDARAGALSALVVVALGVASLVLFEVGSRRVLSRGRPAGSPTELAWDDALRSGALRDLVTAPLALGFYSLLVLGGELANRFGGTTAVVGSILLVGLVAAGFAAFVVTLFTRPQRHYLRRLWPELASTQDGHL